MKLILPVLALIIGFGTGWYFSGKRIQENVKAVMPSEMHESVDAIAEYLAPMTKEEVNEHMKSMREFAAHAVDEGNHQVLWFALNADIYKTKLENEGEDAAVEFADAMIQLFHEQYDEGMELGESQMIADALYTRTKSEEIQAE
jgi:flagellar basal body-associated protein FliL